MTKPWFKPKRFGYGAGLPCSWEGWVALAALVGGIFLTQALAFFMFPLAIAMPLWFVVATALVIAFGLVARAHTEGGWRWRNGE